MEAKKSDAKTEKLLLDLDNESLQIIKSPEDFNPEESQLISEAVPDSSNKKEDTKSIKSAKRNLGKPEEEKGVQSKPKESPNKDDEFLIDSQFFDDLPLTPTQKKAYSLTPRVRPEQNDDLNFMIKRDESDMDKLLDSDHPLLERFQRSLKQQLSSKIETLKADVGNLENHCKVCNAEKEVLGIEAYQIQQVINKQHLSIEEILLDLETTSGAVEEMEHKVSNTLENYNATKNELQEAERIEQQVRNELESMDMMVKQMKQWEEDVESELRINQRMLDKTVQDKAKAFEEKRQQDFMINRLMAEVWKLEGELDKTLVQMRVKEADRERLAEAAAMANIDIEAAQSEHRCLLHGWNSVLSTISRRDKYCNELQDDLKKLQNKYSTTVAEIGNLKKQVQRQHRQNENLTLLRDRVDTIFKQTTRTTHVESGKRDDLIRSLAEVEKYIDQCTKDIEVLENHIHLEKSGQSLILKEINDFDVQRNQYEHDFLEKTHNKMIVNFAGGQMLKQLADIKDQNRNLIINIARVEFSISQKQAEYQSLKMDNMELSQEIDAAIKALQEEDKRLDDLYKQSEQCEKLQKRTVKTFEALKFNVPKEGDKDSKELSSQEIKIKQLEATIGDLAEKNKQAQKFWLREQAIVVELSEKRQAQINDINLLKKQIAILDQKNLKIIDELEAYSKQEAEVNRSINLLQNKLKSLTSNLNKKENDKENINNYNMKVAQQLTAKLEECEFESLKLKAEIKEIDEDKFALGNELIEKNREYLGWEKKLQMINEARKTMIANKTESSEIGQMKGEIHRMNVRYSQLRKAQEKLLSDLDNCVARRDAIVTLAEAKTRHIKGSTQKWRINFNKKMDDCKNRISQLKKDIEDINEKIQRRNNEYEEINLNIETDRANVSENEGKMEKLRSEIESLQINKQLNLDILLFKQRKLKVYSELARGRMPFVQYKSSSAAHEAYVRERNLNSKLRTVVEDLQTDFPQHNIFLTKMHNSLGVPALNL